jgi:hypothetical protein
MIYKVRVSARATPEQLIHLQELGCDEKPYITFPSYRVYKAEMNAEATETMRTIECVMSVEKMPTYSV